VYYYPPFVWGDPSQALEDDGEEFWDEDDYGSYESGEEGMEPDDGMSWEEEGADQGQLRGPNVGGPAPSGSLGVSPGPLSSQTIQPPVQRNPPTQSVTAQQANLGLGPSPNLRSQTSRERLATQNSFASSTGSGGKDIIDPAQVTETRKLTATPSIAREDGSSNSSSSAAQLTGVQRSFSSSSIVSGSSSAESAGSKRNREEPSDSDMGDGKRSKGKVPDKRLRKDRGIGGESRDSHESLDVTQVTATPEKKKKGSMFGNLFGKKKDKKDKDGKRPISTGDGDSLARSSVESVLINAVDNMSGGASRNESAEGFARGSQSPQSVVRPAESPVSEHTIRLQQKDQEQQLRYQEYLKKSSSPPDASSSFGPQPAASQQLDNSQSYSSTGTNVGLAPGPRNTRPGSLILNTSAVDGTVVPDLSVLRVFAGDNLQSEATFKTVLINASTTSSDLVRQAMQRFRLPHGEDSSDYYLTVKQIGGDEATLRSEEHPLGAFEQLVQRAMSIPTVKRSSVGSISSLASNLSMHPAIAKLGMNDFTDDSTVKFYLHRALKISDASREEEPSVRESLKDESEAEGAPLDAQQPRPLNRGLLTVSTSGEGFGAVSPERFSSPSSRFAVQIVIYPEDLPDGMVFDPHTEAIVPRSTLQHRSGSSTAISPGVSQTHRRKIFVFPKNTTVAEVIEASLERFGIVEGVVEGGDDVEDKLAKRRSSARVRYGLAASYPDGQREYSSVAWFTFIN
jgi:Ras association (RalGDS/AF-6) domain